MPRQFSSAIIVLACFAVTEELVATMGGIVYFQDYKRESRPEKFVVFSLSLCVSVVAVFMMAYFRIKRDSARRPNAVEEHDPDNYIALYRASQLVGTSLSSRPALGMSHRDSVASRRITLDSRPEISIPECGSSAL